MVLKSAEHNLDTNGTKIWHILENIQWHNHGMVKEGERFCKIEAFLAHYMLIQTLSIPLIWFKVANTWLGWCFACILVVLKFLRYFPQRQIRGNMRKCVSQMTDIELDGASVAKITLFQGWPSKKSPIFNTMYENLHKLYSNVLCI